MKFSDQKPWIFTLSSALVGYVAIKIAFDPASLDPAIIFALGIIIGSVIHFLSGRKSSMNEGTSNIQSMTIYVGNLPYRANEQVVRDLFEQHGHVFSVRLLKDKHTGKRRGFGFVEMPEKDAKHAIQTLNDFEFQQRTLKVREAKQKQSEEQTAS